MHARRCWARIGRPLFPGSAMNAPESPKPPPLNMPEMVIATVAGVAFGVKTGNYLAGIFIGIVLGVVLSLIGNRIRSRNKD